MKGTATDVQGILADRTPVGVTANHDVDNLAVGGIDKHGIGVMYGVVLQVKSLGFFPSVRGVFLRARRVKGKEGQQHNCAFA